MSSRIRTNAFSKEIKASLESSSGKGMEWSGIIIIREWKGMKWNRMYLSKGKSWKRMEWNRIK